MLLLLPFSFFWTTLLWQFYKIDITSGKLSFPTPEKHHLPLRPKGRLPWVWTLRVYITSSQGHEYVCCVIILHPSVASKTDANLTLASLQAGLFTLSGSFWDFSISLVFQDFGYMHF